MLLLAERAQKVKFDSATASATVSWRDNLLIHPAVELFPPMSSDELRALGEDIVKNGFTSPIVLWRARPNERAILLDGRIARSFGRARQRTIGLEAVLHNVLPKRAQLVGRHR